MEFKEDTITFNKMVFLLMLAILGGGSLFTGYSIKAETAAITKAEIKEILQEQLSPIEDQINITNSRSAVMSYRLDELTRRLENLER